MFRVHPLDTLKTCHLLLTGNKNGMFLPAHEGLQLFWVLVYMTIFETLPRLLHFSREKIRQWWQNYHEAYLALKSQTWLPYPSLHEVPRCFIKSKFCLLLSDHSVQHNETSRLFRNWSVGCCHRDRGEAGNSCLWCCHGLHWPLPKSPSAFGVLSRWVTSTWDHAYSSGFF